MPPSWSPPFARRLAAHPKARFDHTPRRSCCNGNHRSTCTHPRARKSAIDDVILGLLRSPRASRAGTSRAWPSLRAGLPVEVPGATVNRLCASGLEAISLADHRIRSGAASVIIAGGAESMSLIPTGGNNPSPNPRARRELSWSSLTRPTAERVARHYGISRIDQEKPRAGVATKKALTPSPRSRKSPGRTNSLQ